jgi:polysaccharide deacetylase family protein (PEP-CTERM system associated)
MEAGDLLVALQNFFTVDLEDWFHGNYQGAPKRYSVSTVVDDTARLLDLLARNGVRATFFCLGQVAVSSPGLIKRVHAAGHEIASHGQNHCLAYSQSPEEFRTDVLECKRRLEDITGERVLGYRAPSWSITMANLWALVVLEEMGFAYDSSIFPIKTYLYGVRGAPRFPYVPRIADGAVSLVEIPPSTFRIGGWNVGFAGGFYLRVLPTWIQIHWGRSINRTGKPFMLYVHPREIAVPQQPRLPLNRSERLIYYWAIHKTEAKLEAFFRRFECTRIRDVIVGGRHALPTLPVSGTESWAASVGEATR